MAVTAVDEQDVERLAEVRGDGRRRSHETDDGGFQFRFGDRALPRGQRIQSTVARIDERLVEVFPAGLILLAAVVVVEGVQDRTRRLGRRAEIDRRLTAPRPDLEPRAAVSALAVGECELIEGEALVTRHESLHRLGVSEEVVAATHPIDTAKAMSVARPRP